MDRKLRVNPNLVIKPVGKLFGAWSFKTRQFLLVDSSQIQVLERFLGGTTVRNAVEGLSGQAIGPMMDGGVQSNEKVLALIGQLAEHGILLDDTPEHLITRTRPRSSNVEHSSPIFIVGCPRSGTTLVRWLVDSHPEISCPPESKVLSGLRHLWYQTQFSRGLATRVGRDVVLNEMRAFATALLATPAVRDGKPRWADKTPDNVYCLDFIDELFDRSPQFVFVLRHGFDVAQSLDENTPPGLPTFIGESTKPYLARLDFRLQAFCEYWRDISKIGRSFSQRHPERCQVLRYEDLVGNPEDSLEKMFSFLKVRLDPQIVERAFHEPREIGIGDRKILRTRKIEGNRIGLWRQWDPSVCQTLAPTVNGELMAHGYEPLQA